MEDPKPEEIKDQKQKSELSEEDLKGVTGGGVRIPQPEEPQPQRSPSPPEV
jgi:hypothetical protein